MKLRNIRLRQDNDHVEIYLDNGWKERTPIVYWDKQEWLEDPELVVPAILQAVTMYYTGKHTELLEVLGLGHLIPPKNMMDIG